METGLKRISSRDQLDRLDRESLDFHHKVHEGYRLVCEKYPERIKVVDANQPVDQVEQQSLQLVMELIERNG